MFASIPYAVLALGDTNYDKFCAMGKGMDKRLHELGGCRADEQTGECVIDYQRRHPRIWKSGCSFHGVVSRGLPFPDDIGESAPRHRDTVAPFSFWG